MNNEFKLEDLLKSLLASSQIEIKEVIKMLETYRFYELLFYIVINISWDIKDWKPVADLPIWIIEYSIGLVLSVEKFWDEIPSEEECKIFMDKIIWLWTNAWMWSMLMWNDEFVSQVSSSFLTISWHDYDEHLINYLEWLFWDFKDYFDKKLWFSLEDILILYENSKIINKEYPFILNPIDSKSESTINFFSSSIGDNKDFLEWKFWGLFWLKKSIVPNKSIIKFQENYFIFQPLLILRNIKDNFEEVLKGDKDEWDKYEKNRAKLLEDKSIEYILKMLPWAKWYVNLKYDWDKETDWLIIYDNNVFIIEAKAWVLRKPSTKWNQKMLEEDINQLMLKWYEQALRTKKYIEDNEKANFTYDKWKKITLEKNKINKIYLINTTWDYLWLISLQLDIQREKWNIDSNVHFWSIYINDLKVISEVIEFPSQFLLFLDRRNRLIDFPKIKFADELDIFMDFIGRWLFFEDWKVYWEKMEKYTRISMDTTLTDELDRFYLGEGKKPSMKIESRYKDIINSVELEKKYWFSEVTTFLLSINQDETLKMLETLKIKVLEDNKLHSFTWLFWDVSLISLIIIKRKDKSLNRESFIKYSKAKLWQTKSLKAYNLYFDIDLEWNIIFNDFDIVILEDLDKTEDYKKTVEFLKNNKWFFEIDVKTWKKLNRKSPCPCWSWKKFKRCCWDKYYN